MDVIYERCCGIDVHKNMLVACIFTGRQKEIREFGTMTADIRGLIGWLQEKKCQAVAMESTGVYWKPVYNLLETEGMTLIVANAQHIKAVPGRKTDVKDADWIADLARHGLIKSSFIPNKEQRELRELTRYRQEIVEERAREINRIQAVLKGANIKLASVLTGISGKSGMSMLEALIVGKTDAATLSDLALGRAREKLDLLEKAMEGSVGQHQRIMLRHQVDHIRFLDTEIERLDEEIKKKQSLPLQK